MSDKIHVGNMILVSFESAWANYIWSKFKYFSKNNLCQSKIQLCQKCFMSDKIHVGIYDIGLIRKRMGELHLEQIQKNSKNNLCQNFDC